MDDDVGHRMEDEQQLDPRSTDKGSQEKADHFARDSKPRHEGRGDYPRATHPSEAKKAHLNARCGENGGERDEVPKEVECEDEGWWEARRPSKFRRMAAMSNRVRVVRSDVQHVTNEVCIKMARLSQGIWKGFKEAEECLAEQR